MNSPGYCPCACRDCMELASSDHGEVALCPECQEAGCDLDGETDCCVAADELDCDCCTHE
jgi:hypothetical protein